MMAHHAIPRLADAWTYMWRVKQSPLAVWGSCLLIDNWREQYTQKQVCTCKGCKKSITFALYYDLQNRMECELFTDCYRTHTWKPMLHLCKISISKSHKRDCENVNTLYCVSMSTAISFTFQQFVWVSEKTLECRLKQNGGKLLVRDSHKYAATAGYGRLQRLHSTRKNSFDKVVQNRFSFILLHLMVTIFTREKVRQTAEQD